MKQVTFFTLISAIILLTALTTAAFGPPEGRGPSAARQVQMMRMILDLTDDQSKAVEEIFADSREKMQVILEEYGLDRQDMKGLRTLTGKFKEEGRKEFAAVLTAEEVEAMREQLFTTGGPEFILLPAEEKQARLQESLGFDPETARQVVEIMEQKKSEHELLLTSLGYDPGQMVLFRQELIAQHEKVKQGLEEILSPEQLEMFNKMKRGRGPQGHGAFPAL